MFPYIFDMGQRIKTEVEGIAANWLFLAGWNFGGANIAAASDTGVKAAVTLADGETTEVTTGITSPAVPRALRIKGNQAGVTGNVVIEGTNYLGEAITETIAANAGSAVEGNKAFKTVTKITFPARAGAGDTISVGWNDKLGLPYLLSRNTVLAAFLDNAKEGTAPTVTTSATAIESNTIDLNSALNNKPVYAILILP